MGPWITKMDAQGAKIEPPGPQNHLFWYQRTILSSRQPVSSCLLKGGPAAGGEALKSAALAIPLRSPTACRDTLFQCIPLYRFVHTFVFTSLKKKQTLL